MAKNSRKTGPRAASDAGRVLADPGATADERSAAASALSQVADVARQTRAQAASDAGRVLADPGATADERSAAASALSQTPSRSRKAKDLQENNP